MDQAYLANRMLCSNVTNGYEGLDELAQFAASDPEFVWRVIWAVLTKESDPGKDDGAMCLELLRIASSGLGRAILERRLLSAWDSLPSEIRQNIIHGLADASVFSLDTAVEMFDRPSTSVRERHLICATLASCRHNEAGETILNLLQRIGRYKDSNHQARLEAFVKSAIASYG